VDWTELLKSELESAYGTADRLMDLVDETKLDWKPPIGENWMTTGQLLRHLTDACGAACRGFVTGEWGMPEGPAEGEQEPAEMLPSAEDLPTISSVAEAKQLLAADKQLALDMLARAGEDRLTSEMSSAPWDPSGMILGHRILQMINHLAVHRSQLFYYLKLQGKPVNTSHLWG
jgi:uncharacterized damage-inducible protein DinB